MTNMNFVRTADIILSDRRGVYIPQNFAKGFIIGADGWQGISSEDLECVKLGPYSEENEWYWEAWESILNSAYLIDSDGLKWTLFQDGDLYAIPELPTGFLGVGEMGGDIILIDAVAETLALGRKHRLEGRIPLALIHEASAEEALRWADEFDADELLTVWEGSMEADPFDLPEWQKAREQGHYESVYGDEPDDDELEALDCAPAEV